MMEPDEVSRWRRHARALGRKADDAAGLAQVLELVEAFEDAAMQAVSRLLDEGFSYAELARDMGVSRQAVRQRHVRWLHRQAAAHGPVAPVLEAALRALAAADSRPVEQVAVAGAVL